MINNEHIEQRKSKKKKARKAFVTVQLILILILFLAVLYGLFAIHPEWTRGRFARLVPNYLKERIAAYQNTAQTDPEPVMLPETPTPTPEETQTPTPTPTPTPVPTIAPEIEELRLPSFEDHTLDDWELLLVNADNPIPGAYDFNLIYVDEDQEFAVDPRIANDLLNMLAACRMEGLTPMICSAYRDPSTQTYLYEEEGTPTPTPTPSPSATPTPGASTSPVPSATPSPGASATPGPTASTTPTATPTPSATPAPEPSASIAIPGTSEHEIGLAVDIFSEENTELDESQERTRTQQWLMRHCHEYGFILRYPKGKSDLTGIVYEPWHYRYVGVDIATDIMKNQLCLEEYIDRMQTVQKADEALARQLGDMP